MKFPKNYAFQLQNNFVTSQKSLLNVSFVQKNEIMVSFKFQHAFENECNLNGNFVLYFTHRFFLSENFFIFSRFFCCWAFIFLANCKYLCNPNTILNLCIDYLTKNINIKIKQKLVWKWRKRPNFLEKILVYENFSMHSITYFLFRY